MKHRIMAIDWGTKRFGIALTDPLNITAQPLTVIRRKSDEELWGSLKQIIDQHGVNTIIVGVPLRTDGKKGEKEALVRAWLEKARRRFSSVNWVGLDERFTTQEAGRILQEKGVRAKGQRESIDKFAAALILEQFLETKSLHP